MGSQEGNGSECWQEIKCSRWLREPLAFTVLNTPLLPRTQPLITFPNCLTYWIFQLYIHGSSSFQLHYYMAFRLPFVSVPLITCHLELFLFHPLYHVCFCQTISHLFLKKGSLNSLFSVAGLEGSKSGVTTDNSPRSSAALLSCTLQYSNTMYHI